MQGLSGDLLLAAWDEAAPENELNRALTLLSLALPERERAELADLPIFERNLLLLSLRELSFGPDLRMTGSCSGCAARFEFTLPIESVRTTIERLAPRGPAEWDDGDSKCRLRSVNTNDLLAVLDEPDLRQAENRLLARCLEATPTLPEAAVATDHTELYQRFDELHAAGEVRCGITCLECSASEILDLDVSRMLWLEVRSAAQRLLWDIHELAAAYCWSERSIAEMTPRRRGAYLEVIGA